MNYATEPGEVGFLIPNMGRMLVWLRILRKRYPYLANGVDNVPLRWNFVKDDGRLFGSVVSGDGDTRYVQVRCRTSSKTPMSRPGPGS